MEKDVVILSITEYNNLLRHSFHLKNEISNYDKECCKLKGEFNTLSVFAIRQAAIEWRIEKYSIEELLKFDSFTSAIGKDDMNTLINLGVPFSRIVEVIKEMKEEQDGNE